MAICIKTDEFRIKNDVSLLQMMILISLGAALASKTGAARWMAQAKAAGLARKLLAESLIKDRDKKLETTEDGADAPSAQDRAGTFTAVDHLRGVVGSRAMRTAVIFTAKVTAQTKEEAMSLKKQAGRESEAEDFRSAIATLYAALTLWPDHPLNGNPELKEDMEVAQTKQKAQKVSKDDESALKTRNCVLKTRNYVLNMMNFAVL